VTGDYALAQSPPPKSSVLQSQQFASLLPA
jgi:hypothetical protein